jgi:glucose/arabinose dehydrogenase
VDRQGNLWVADTGNHRLVTMNMNGEVLGGFGQSGNGDGQFAQAYDIAVEPNGNLTVLDAENPKPFMRFSSAGLFLNAFGGGMGLYHPRGLAIDGAGNYWVADPGSSRVLLLSQDGTLLQQWSNQQSTFGTGQPTSVAPLPEGGAFAVEAVSGYVWKLLTGTIIRGWQAVTSADTVNGPRIALGPKNNLYLTDPEGRRVVVYSQDGTPLGQIRMADESTGTATKPVGIALGADGTLLITDSARCQVLAFRLPDSLLH